MVQPPETPDDSFDHGMTSTWDDWLVLRSSTGHEYADGVARVLLDPNFRLDDLDFGSEGNRDGFRELFAEFETDTAGQPITGRSMALKRRSPDAWHVDTVPAEGKVRLTFGEPGGPGMFVVMDAFAAATLVQAIASAIQSLNDTP